MIEVIQGLDRPPQRKLLPASGRNINVDDDVAITLVAPSGSALHISNFAANHLPLAMNEWVHIIYSCLTCQATDNAGGLIVPNASISLFGIVASLLTGLKTFSSVMPANTLPPTTSGLLWQIGVVDEWFRFDDYMNIPLVGGANAGGFTLVAEMGFKNLAAVNAGFQCFYRTLWEKFTEVKE